MQLLILEEDPLIALDLQTTLRKIDPSVEIMALLHSVETAIAWFQSNASPDLAFFDVQLADGCSIDIFKETTIECPVVFCTALNDCANLINQANALACLSKPFSVCCVKNALDKANRLERFFLDKIGNDQKSRVESPNPSYKSNFLVAQKDKLVPIAVSDSACFFIEDEVLFLQTADHGRFVLQRSLDELERVLDPNLFFRANRQYIINKKAVLEIQHYFARKLLVKLKTPVKIPIVISKARAREFLYWMES